MHEHLLLELLSLFRLLSHVCVLLSLLLLFLLSLRLHFRRQRVLRVGRPFLAVRGAIFHFLHWCGRLVVLLVFEAPEPSLILEGEMIAGWSEQSEGSG